MIKIYLLKSETRLDIYEIPIPAIREAIVNAIVHRDCTIGGTNIQIEVLADRVEISNPGGLPEGLTKSMFGKKSVRRNELLAELFHRMDKSERIGSGIPRIKRLLLEVKLKPAIFSSDSFFTVTFERSEEYRTVKNKGKSSLKLGKTAQKIVNIIKENPNITSIEMAKLLDISDRAVKKQLANLQTKGAIGRIGADKGGTWKVL